MCKCGKVRPQPNSDDLCLLFCLYPFSIVGRNDKFRVQARMKETVSSKSQNVECSTSFSFKSTKYFFIFFILFIFFIYIPVYVYIFFIGFSIQCITILRTGSGIVGQAWAQTLATLCCMLFDLISSLEILVFLGRVVIHSRNTIVRTGKSLRQPGRGLYTSNHPTVLASR